MAVNARAAAFALVFYGVSAGFALGAPLVALGGDRAMIRYAVAWTRFHARCAQTLLGVTTQVEGSTADGPVLYAAKHQAMYETLELTRLLDAPAVVLKRELARIPLWGWAARVYGCIAVDRAGSAAALRRMMTEARAAREAGRSVLIFPEGTRVPPGATPPLQSGFAGLYRALALPVVPVALDSGRLLPRRGRKRPGAVTIRLGEPIPPGLPRREVEALVHAAINALERSPSRAQAGP